MSPQARFSLTPALGGLTTAEMQRRIPEIPNRMERASEKILH